MKRRTRPPAGASSRTARAPSRPATGAARPPLVPPHVLRAACLAAPVAAALALAWSLRGAPLGSPVADDFEFMVRVVFHRPLDWFDSMGATYYWRPLTRQVWFSLVTPLLLAAPGVVAAIHLAILGATAFVLGRVAGRFAGVTGNALVAAAVLALEPARTLITWPSGIQHLLAALALSLAVHETLAGRRWTAALAAAAAALSHELGALAFVVVALGGLMRGARGRAVLPDALLGAALGVAWAIGYKTALAHGVQLPVGGLARASGAWFRALQLGMVAAFNAETLSATFSRPVATVSGGLFALSFLLLFGRSRRADLDALLPVLGATLAVGWLALLPLGNLLPDWNAWRAWIPVLALVFAITLTSARANLGLAVLLVALRVAALAGSARAGEATGEPPAGVSDLSFPRITRIQRVLEASRPFVRATDFSHDHRVAYWGLPTMTMNGFRNDLAVRVWARDTGLVFSSFEGRDVISHPPALVLSYDTRPGHGPAIRVRPEALAYFDLGVSASDTDESEEAAEYYRQALAAQTPESPSLSAQLLHNLAMYEASKNRYDRADSLNALATRIRGLTPDGLAVDALVALGRGDLARATRLTDSCLRLDPRNRLGRYMKEQCDKLASQGQAGAGGAPPSGPPRTGSPLIPSR